MTSLDDRYQPITVSDRDDIGSNPSSNTPLIEVGATRVDRRGVLKGFVTGVLAAGATVTSRSAFAADDPSTLTFTQPKHVILEDQQVSPGYRGEVLIRWGDPVLPGAPAWDPNNLTAEGQAKQFGYNNDFVGYFPLPLGSNGSDHGLLHVNHEYTNLELMFADWSKDKETAQQTAVDLAAHGGSVIEVRKENGRWRVVPDSTYARRIDVNTEMRISGPAAGHARMKTGYDAAGTKVFGTMNNCAGGKTPWGTVMMAEENFDGYFGGDNAEKSPQAAAYKRLGISSKSRNLWFRSIDRFNLDKEPNEPNRFGWMVEYDPYDPKSVPVKRTALGRFKHEGATCTTSADGRVVVYSGDDERFEYVYKFVSADKINIQDRAANRDLLDRGTLYAARLNADGSGEWLPLVHGQGPLTPQNGFDSQAEVMIDCRRAADLLKATPMDRPEDIEPNPVNGRVYVMLTNNTSRKPEQVDAANPRPNNAHGQVVEIIPNGDHAALGFRWQLFLLAGDPRKESDKAVYHPRTETWLSSPDNVAFDPQGRMWISSDQGSNQRKTNIPDGIYACDVDGAGRALLKFFYGVPRDAEMCGPEFTPDGRTLFVAVQHPGEGDKSTFNTPSTRWPDFKDGVPPRPAIVAITKDDGGLIGS